MLRCVLIALLLPFVVAAAEPGAAQEDSAATLLVGTRAAPPFAMRAADGSWQGISIELWERIAADLGLRFDWRETTLKGMIDDVSDGSLDLSIAATTITPEREARVDFSHPYFHSDLGAAVTHRPWSGLEATARALASREFLTTVGLLTTLLFVVGALTWLVERRSNAGQFEAEPRRGLLSGFWWAVVTTTTVGYGDKAPITLAGRLIATVWMFVALILIAVVTAQLAANITKQMAGAGSVDLDDLARARIGVVDASSAGAIMRNLGARPADYPSVADGFAALVSGRIDVFMHDVAVLVWESAGRRDVTVTSLRFAPQDYGIVLRQGSDLREPVNRALLAILDSPDWTAIQRRYLGKAADGVGP